MAEVLYNDWGQEEKKILVVDDDKDIRDVLYDILTFQGFDAEAVEDGEIALEKLLQTPYDLLITDINMPKMDGIELLDKIHENEVQVTTIVMSNFIPQISREYAKRRKIFGCVSKPFRLDEFISVVEKGLEVDRVKDVQDTHANVQFML